ncbi:DUF4410 domain-containing protein [Cupriavidus agavae]|uniref:Uncharacterized protein DUF4410 n=1 Tax=Cupriavidus agavae TaxID=1001822 RepID=A0A4Q7REP5_9BURK|nr:DUF4410 domain-containing protein [Cupriavidus agavae]RZT30848.1 uncharacterized protein DUF4410 [Cupriavidus agavae]
MHATLKTLSRRLKLTAVAALAASSMMMSGCASATTMISEPMPPVSAQAIHPDVIYVRGFDAADANVKVDTGMMKRIAAMASGSTASGQDKDSQDARNAAADEIVKQLQAQGLNAVRLDGPVPADANALVVEGRFETIDEGKQRRRLLIGLGAGKSDVTAAVQVSYQPANGQAVPLALFETHADSGHLPGMAETAGVGALAGHVAVSAAADAGVHGATGVSRDSVSGEARRVGDAVAREVTAVLNGQRAAASRV